MRRGTFNLPRFLLKCPKTCRSTCSVMRSWPQVLRMGQGSVALLRKQSASIFYLVGWLAIRDYSWATMGRGREMAGRNDFCRAVPATEEGRTSLYQKTLSLLWIPEKKKSLSHSPACKHSSALFQCRGSINGTKWSVKTHTEERL